MGENESLEILMVATKTPWPAVDGGRVVMLSTLDALAAAGHRTTLVAPIDPAADDRPEVEEELAARCRPRLVAARPRGRMAAALSSLMLGPPMAVARHVLPALRRSVETLLAEEHFDVVQAEQLQAVPQADPARARGVPLVYRAHNLESVIWAHVARRRHPLLRPMFAVEARRLAVWEAAAVRRADLTVALTELDVPRLRRLADGRRVERVAPPFPHHLEPCETELPGSPAVVTLASDWLPSRDATDRLIGDWWPAIRSTLPKAELHVFGGDRAARTAPMVHLHPSPQDSRQAFPSGAVLAMPIRHPTGIPVKGLEAWARGLPMVASSETAVALEAEDGTELLVADDPGSFAQAVARVATDDGVRQRLIEGGRAALRRRHDPATIANRLAELYAEVRG